MLSAGQSMIKFGVRRTLKKSAQVEQYHFLWLIPPYFMRTSRIQYFAYCRHRTGPTVFGTSWPDD